MTSHHLRVHESSQSRDIEWPDEVLEEPSVWRAETSS